MTDYKRIGEILLSKGRITPAQLQTAVEARRLSHQRIGHLLTSLGFVTESEVAEALADQFGLRVVDPEKMRPTRQALGLLDSHQALVHRILPLKYSKDCLECIMADPVDFPTTDMIARLAGKRIVVHVAPSSAITNAIIDAYGVTGTAERARKLSQPKPQMDRSSLLQQLSTYCAGGTAALSSTIAGGSE
jgi:type IV pilus assembly protein PilB